MKVGRVRVCRGLTEDCKALRPGDIVYVDLAGFVWPRLMVLEHRASHPLLVGAMRMRVGVYQGPRKLLGLIPWGTLVEVEGRDE